MDLYEGQKLKIYLFYLFLCKGFSYLNLCVFKYPKTHSATILSHGSHNNTIDVLDLIMMVNVPDLKINIKTDNALLSIEGGNSTRLNLLSLTIYCLSIM